MEDLILALLEPLLEVFGEVLLQLFFEVAAGVLRQLNQAWAIGRFFGNLLEWLSHLL